MVPALLELMSNIIRQMHIKKFLSLYMEEKVYIIMEEMSKDHESL